MSIVSEVYDALGGIALPMAVLVLVTAVGLVNLLFRYARADIGQYSFHLTGGWQTFFIKNFNSISYEGPLLVHVDAEALDQVIVHAGPACRRAPERLADGTVQIVFTEVPADASFVVRVKADGKPIMLRIPEQSPLQSRSFHRPIVAATLPRTLARYLVRYLVGAVTMIGVFLFGLHLRSEEVWAADYALTGAAVLLSVFSFWLVAPLEGKSIVAGYVGWGDTGRSWRQDSAPANSDALAAHEQPGLSITAVACMDG